MSWPAVTGTSEIEAIIGLVKPWLHVVDVRRPAILVDAPIGPYEFEALVTWQDGMTGTARETRARLLDRAEDAMAALETHGWHPAEYPVMRFDGSLTPLVCTIAREL